ncbi:hypothetical protein [Polyangium sp. y55x31]|uniref:hypothetical protein n=1 Tax=Polyangium sp. y55x31 TaxID=3042688 RepID=UPI0024828CE9|nr:hypothetical protein [Polyangium sp. y55x31]MDI1478729.1 hypothetical protein [Polyangium sp. y55x31]
MPDDLRDLSLDERDDHPLLIVRDLERFVVCPHAPAPPLAAVHVLRVLHPSDMKAREPADHELLRSLVGVLAEEGLRLLPEPKQRELTVELVVTALEGCRREKEHPIEALPP